MLDYGFGLSGVFVRRKKYHRYDGRGTYLRTLLSLQKYTLKATTLNSIVNGLSTWVLLGKCSGFAGISLSIS